MATCYQWKLDPSLTQHCQGFLLCLPNSGERILVFIVKVLIYSSTVHIPAMAYVSALLLGPAGSDIEGGVTLDSVDFSLAIIMNFNFISQSASSTSKRCYVMI